MRFCIGSGLVMSQLRKSMRQMSNIELCIQKFISIEDSRNDIIARDNLIENKSSIKSDPKFLEDILEGFDNFSTCLDKIKLADNIENEINETWS
jgi:soluble cytochrome b562